MKEILKIILQLVPVPFLFHLYEYNCHLTGQDPVLLAPGSLFFIIIVGLLTSKNKLSMFFGINFIMVVISLILGYVFIADDGSWFKPFGRDAAVIFISIIYIIGQLFVRGFWNLIISSNHD